MSQFQCGDLPPGPLWIADLVGCHPTNHLIIRMPICKLLIFNWKIHANIQYYARTEFLRYSLLWVGCIRTFHLVRRSPPSKSTHVCPRLACVSLVASVYPEPGSNSSVVYIFHLLFFLFLLIDLFKYHYLFA